MDFLTKLERPEIYSVIIGSAIGVIALVLYAADIQSFVEQGREYASWQQNDFFLYSLFPICVLGIVLVHSAMVIISKLYFELTDIAKFDWPLQLNIVLRENLENNLLNLHLYGLITAFHFLLSLLILPKAVGSGCIAIKFFTLAVLTTGIVFHYVFYTFVKSHLLIESGIQSGKVYVTENYQVYARRHLKDPNVGNLM